MQIKLFVQAFVLALICTLAFAGFITLIVMLAVEFMTDSFWIIEKI